uniref:Trypanothione synthetase n=1 Tax=Trypanosoma brucei brucei TaxID=5702 RepID=Q86MC2_TRYBB|nr:trypanothione synthetase [Trypanosoma brucei brucei]
MTKSALADTKEEPHVPFGEIQGYTPCGVPAYSNGHDGFFSGERSIDGNLFCGFKYQCVEFARRWLYEAKGLVLPDVNWAAHIFDLTEVHDASTATPVPCVKVSNGTAAKPVADSLLIYAVNEDAPWGHVAVITEVGDKWVRIADQNHRFHKWKGTYSAELLLKHEGGVWTVEDHAAEGIFVPLGWVTFPSRPNRNPKEPLVLHESLYFKQPEKPFLRRVVFTPENRKTDWLDLTNEAEAEFYKTFGKEATRGGVYESCYYLMNRELYLNCVRYGTQLHSFFLEATKQVLESDDKLRRFRIPEEYWPRIRHSWKTQPHAITGRFDFVFDENTQEFKCFEYNADSASTLLECAVIQEKWANSVGLDDNATRSSGKFMPQTLVRAWEMTGLKGRVHFLVDDDGEERYTALYVMEKAREAGIDAKLCVMFDEFHFDEKGAVVDSDGIPATAVWKTWMWETAISDHQAAREQRGAEWKPTPKDKVRLCDILLGNNWDVRVFEPMWKLIPSNKAILPIIYNNHPDHPAILPASYELTDELRRTGYAKKPIVGRVGRNVTVTEPDGKVLAESDGNFSNRDMVYQQLFRIPKRGDYYAILGGWMLGDTYSGTGVREDKKLTTGLESPFGPVRIQM